MTSAAQEQWTYGTTTPNPRYLLRRDSVLGPLALDMYLSAMPVMAVELGAAEGQIELTVTAFFIGFCLGQLVMGPLSDKIGSKPVVLGGLTLFLLASVACALSSTIGQFTGWRVVQGVGGSVGLAIAMAAIRDLFTGAMAARLLSMVIMVLGLAPVIAPILGSAMLIYHMRHSSPSRRMNWW